MYNIMTYDYTSGSWGDVMTGHQTPATKNPNDPMINRKGLSTQESAEFYVNLGKILKNYYIIIFKENIILKRFL